MSLGGTFAAIPCESLAAQALPLTFADAADLSLQAPVVAHVRIARASRLKPAEAIGVGPGRTRYYVEADVVSLIRGAQGLPARISYLADMANDAAGRAVKLRKKDEFLIFADRQGTTGSEVRLVATDAQVPYTAAGADRVRAILREATARDAAPRIAGIGRAFHVPGSLPGESETQIFLMAADGRPVSLNVLRRPGETPRWAVSLSEIVDESATAPRPDTLLWYRLACSLPQSLPPQSLAEADPATAPAIQADYQLIKMSLGPCTRSRPAR
ncbi:hypothetical protein IC614_06455 [Allosphingosinicella flava]|uniref:Uncharacterized protein n=2 Tax=Allosphingosinicella flava TaxID=2771430 RepID=A0A7T2LND6_9SPHN|nr:hypothetical protein IC614_06455 [Sphingosinicella flava]